MGVRNLNVRKSSKKADKKTFVGRKKEKLYVAKLKVAICKF